MPYQPTLDDIEEIEGKQASSGYKPSLADINEFDKQNKDLDLLHSTPEEMLKRLTGQTPQGQALTKGAQVGALDMARGVYNLIPRGAQMLGLKAPYQPATAQQFGEDRILPQSLQQQYPGTAEAGKFAGGMIATAPVAGIGTAARGAEALTPYLLKALAKNVGVTGTLSPISQPDTSISQSLKNTFTDPLAYAGIAAGPALHSVATAGNKLKQMLTEKGGNASLEDVQKVIEASNGETKVPLGNAIDSVPLKGLQSTVLAYTPGSGMGKAYQQAGESMSKRIGNILDDLKPNDSETTRSVGQKIQDSLKNSYKEARQENKAKYADFGKSADEAGVRVSTDNYKNVAQNRLDEINQNEVENPELNVLDNQNNMKDLVQNILKTDTKSMKGAALATAKLNDAIRTAVDQGNAYHVGLLSELKGSLDKDIEQSALNSGNPEIQNKFLDAKQHFATKVAPFESDQIYPYVKKFGAKSPDTLLQTFIKTGQYDQPELLDQLVSKSSDPERKAIAHEFLTKGLRETMGGTDIDEDKVLTAYNKLGDRSKQILFSPKERADLDKVLYTRRLFGKDTKISDLISNPTGQKAAIQKVLMGMVGAGGALGGALLSGHAPPGTMEALGTLIGAPLAARYATQKIMGDAAKNAYISSLLKRKLAAPKGISSLPLMAYPSYVNAQNGGNQ